MFVDIHSHCRLHSGFGRAYISPAELLKTYDRYEIERGVVSADVSPECASMPQTVEEVLKIASLSDRFIPFCNVDPRALTNSISAPLGDWLKYYRDLGCRGVGEVVANLAFLDPLVQNLFKGAQEAGMPLTFHMAPMIGETYGLYDLPGLPQLEISLQRFPKLIFLGHSQTFWAEIAPLKNPLDRWGYPAGPVTTPGRVVELMRKYPNLYGDLSAGSGYNALKRDRSFAAAFLNEFQDRLLFGTDTVFPEMKLSLPAFLQSLCKTGEISEIVFQKVARQNAIRLLKL